MGANSAIQWTDDTDNIITVVAEDGSAHGAWCRKISPGCAHCYSETLNQNSFFGGSHLKFSGQPPVLKLRENIIDGWKRQTRPRKHFVSSTTDVFGEWVPQPWIFRYLDGMAAAPRQTFQVLTKRADVALREITAWLAARGLDCLPSNIWIGVSVEDQQRADERIPILLQVPAAVRFLSIEPLLGPVDLTAWLSLEERNASEESGGDRLSSSNQRIVEDRRRGSDLARQQTRGASHGQVLAGARDEEQEEGSCASSSPGMAPLQWRDPGRAHDQPQERRDGREPSSESGARDTLGANPSLNPMPRQGYHQEPPAAEVDARESRGNPETTSLRRGTEGDRFGLRSVGPHDLQDRPRTALGWIIVGGESGTNARPMHPDWPLALRDQCVAAGVPFFFKQWGEWVDYRTAGAQGWEFTQESEGKRYGVLTYADGSKSAARFETRYPWVKDSPVDQWGTPGPCMVRLGKKTAGRLLDGVEWNQFPEVRS